jgi:hypothetical protein
MQLKRVVWLGAGGGALAVWFAAAATTTPSGVVIVPPPARPSAVDTSGAELATEVARLHERLRPEIAPLHTRDLFRYRATAAPRRTVAAVEPVAAVIAAPQAVAPDLSLLGLAEDIVDGQPQRTAIIGGDGGPFFVKEGDALLARYRVRRISADVVELVDEDERPLRLALP